jgi:rare lipoprotein A
MGPMGGAGGVARRAAAIALAGALAGTGCALLRPSSAPEPAPLPPFEDGVQIGEASWYGPGFHGRRTANGERYDQDGLTAAHRTLPFNTRVRVTNAANGRTVDVRINDRGPFVGRRIIDLSRAGARVIGLIGPGVGPVRLEVIAPTTAKTRAAPAAPVPPSPPANAPGPWVVEVALLRDESRAARLREILADRFPDAPVVAAPVPGDGRYRVHLGPFDERTAARAHADDVTRLGWPATLVEEGR